MKDRIRNLLKTKKGKAATAVAIVLMLCTTAHGVGVAVVNYPALMNMVQRQVTQVVVNKIQSVWNEEVKIKLEPGIINPSSVSIPNINMSSWTDQMMNEYVGKMGGYFGGNNSFYNGIAGKSSPLQFPQVSSGLANYQRSVRDVSILLAGPTSGIADLGKYASAEMEKLTRAHGKSRAEEIMRNNLAGFKKVDINRKSSVSTYEKAAEGIYMAEKAKKDLAAINPSSFDKAKSDQAVKDLAKLMYYNTILQAQTLSVMSNAEANNVLTINK